MPPRAQTNKYTRNSNLLAGIQSATLSEVTKKGYLERWRVLLDTHGYNVFYMLGHPEKVIPWVESTYSAPTTRKSYLSAVLAMFRHNPGLKDQLRKHYDTWYAAFAKAHEAVDERYRKNQPTEKQIHGYAPFAEVIQTRDAQKPGSDERLLLSMYTYIPPLRCDFNRIRLVGVAGTKQDEGATTEPNYMEWRTKDKDFTVVLVLREFKTSKKMEKYEKQLPVELVDEIEKSLEKHPRTFLFEDRFGRPYRASSFTRWANRMLQRLFRRPMTVSLLRHSYINSLDFNQLTVEEKERIAKEMAHSVGTQDRYRLIFRAAEEEKGKDKEKEEDD